MSDNLCERCYKKPYYCDIRAHGSGGGTISCTSFHPQTNADRIRAMMDEELAEFMANNVGCDDCRFFATCRSAPQDRVCAEKWLDWLKEEAEP